MALSYLQTRSAFRGRISTASGDMPVSVADFPGGDAQSRLVAALASGETNLTIGEQITIEAAVTVAANTRLAGQPGARITASGTNINALVLGGDGICLEDLEIVASGTASSAYNGAGVYAIGRTGLAVRRVVVRNHKGYGVALNECLASTIEDNSFYETANTDPTEAHTQNADIALLNSCQDNIIRFNRCFSGSGQGVALQTPDANRQFTMHGNLIIANKIKDCIGYGIMLYQRLPNPWEATNYSVNDYVLSEDRAYIYRCTTDGGGAAANAPVHTSGTVTGGDGYAWLYLGTTIGAYEDNHVVSNRIKNISGALSNSNIDPEDKQYGAGIYVQQADDTDVVDNRIRDVCLETTVTTLAPGFVGLVNSGRCRIIGNTGRNSGQYGLKASNVNGAGYLEAAEIEGNEWQNTLKESQYIVGMERVRSKVNKFIKAGHWGTSPATNGVIYAVDDRVTNDNRAYKCTVSPGTAMSDPPTGSTATQVRGDGYTWILDAYNGMRVDGASGVATRVVSEGDQAIEITSNGIQSGGTSISELTISDFKAEKVGSTGIICSTTITDFSAKDCKIKNSSRAYSIGAGCTVTAWNNNSSTSSSNADVLSGSFPAGAHLVGAGTPEGAITAAIGARYTRTNGGAGTSLYVKESGSGDTGWVGK